MVKESRLLPCLLITALLTAGANSQIYVLASETRSWGVERIHAYCLWDNDSNKEVDEGANAGNAIRIAVIDSGVYYYIDRWGNRVYHPDLWWNIASGAKFRWDGSGVDIDEGVFMDGVFGRRKT